ncbi:aldo/keto reductase [Lutibacter oricola]|uniref:aldo/keto reductase n=1 Tax=Lutibacter oricola TaxID=762486 RepID=UPI00158740CF|nr:aldo/keto reductase [Lutibacter oricola]
MHSDKKIILGTVQFGLNYGINNKFGKPNFDVVKHILDTAFKKGIKFLDTAEVYGDSHNVISRYHEVSNNRFKIITKYSASQLNYSINFLDRIKELVKLFDVDYLYAYLFHSYEEFKKVVDYNLNGFDTIINNPLVTKVGVSVYSNEQLEDVLNYDFVKIVQVPYNLLDNDFQRGQVLSKLHAKGVEIHTRSVFLQGLFFKDVKSLTGNLIEFKEKLELINSISDENELKKVELALNYPLSKKYISKVLIGVDSLEQLKENIKSINSSIDLKVWKKIDNIKIKDNQLLNPSKWDK